MLNIAKKFISITQYILIALGIIIAVMFIIPKLIGITPFVVLSGSMENEIKTGSVAYGNTHVRVEDINVGDIIIFQLDETTVTHRVVSINDDNTFTTKGDANQTEDLAPVKFESYKGKTMFSIPYLGYIVNAIKTRTGHFIFFSLIGLNIVYLIFSKEDEEKKINKKGKETEVEEVC